jgi:hypothetical protein
MSVAYTGAIPTNGVVRDSQCVDAMYFGFTSELYGVTSAFVLAGTLGAAVKYISYFQAADQDAGVAYELSLGYTAAVLLLSAFATRLTVYKYTPFALQLARSEGANIRCSISLITAPWLWVILTSLSFSALGQLQWIQFALKGGHSVPAWVLLTAVATPLTLCTVSIASEGVCMMRAWCHVFGKLLMLCISVGIVTGIDLWVYWHAKNALPPSSAVHVHHYQIGMVLFFSADISSAHGSDYRHMAPLAFCLCCLGGMLQGVGLGMFVHGVFAYGPDLIWDLQSP